MKNKQLSKLNKVYRKRFNELNKILLNEPSASLWLLVEHLKYLRDTTIIKGNNEVLENNILVTLMMALNEFYSALVDTKQKEFHWENFCEFLKLNMEEWLALNDSI